MLLAFAAMVAAQDMGSMPMVQSPAKAKFGPLPNIPACAKGAGLHGDPMQGAFVLLIKTTAGCTVPRHWHTANEQVGLVSGSAALSMPNEKAQAMTAGSYVYLPSKNQHSFTCKTACMFYLAGDEKFDIHYVDDAGQEITPEQAFKMKSKSGKKGAAGAKSTTTTTTKESSETTTKTEKKQ
jgi:quercetin dioxygenase-like cupin family protein